MDDAVRGAGGGEAAAIHNAGVVPVAVGYGGGVGPFAAGERTAPDGARHPKKTALIFGASTTCVEPDEVRASCDEHRQVWPVRVMCAVLGLSPSGYYAWRSRPESQRSVANHELTEDIRLIHAQSSGCYGSPRVHATLRRHGRRVGRSRVERLMRRAGLRGLAALPRRARTTNSRHGYPIAPNRLARNFEAAAPN